MCININKKAFHLIETKIVKKMRPLVSFSYRNSRPLSHLQWAIESSSTISQLIQLSTACFVEISFFFATASVHRAVMIILFCLWNVCRRLQLLSRKNRAIGVSKYNKKRGRRKRGRKGRGESVRMIFKGMTKEMRRQSIRAC